MRRKVAAICVSALTLAVSGGAFAAGEGQSGSQQGQQSGMQGSQTGSGAQAGSSASGQRSGSTSGETSAEQSGSQGTVSGETGPAGQSQQGSAAQTQQGAGQQQAQAGQGAGGTISFSSMNNDQVKMLQQKLKDDGRYQGKIDGIIGPKTIAALRDFQAQNGLKGGGALTRETLDALGLSWEQMQAGERQAVSGREGAAGQQPGGMRGETARQPAVGKEGVQLSQLNTDQLRELQQKLQDLGFYRGQVDGKWGTRTKAALRQFYNKQAQLAARGMISEHGASALGLDVSAVQQPVSGTEETGAPPKQRQPQQRQQPPQQQQQQQPSEEGAPPQGTHEGMQHEGGGQATPPQGTTTPSPSPYEQQQQP